MGLGVKHKQISEQTGVLLDGWPELRDSGKKGGGFPRIFHQRAYLLLAIELILS